jgi:hypothetical protein
MIRLKLLFIALLGSYLSFIIIDKLITPVSIWQYVGIEGVVIIFHAIYNYMRDKVLETEE